jgi:hypothetical protein
MFKKMEIAMSSEKYSFTRRHIAQNRNINLICETSNIKIQLYFVSYNITVFFDR